MKLREDIVKGFKYFEAGDYDRAAKQANRVLKFDEENAPALLLLGNIALKGNRWKTAQKHYELGLRVARSPEQKAPFFRNLGAVYLKNRDFRPAAEMFAKEFAAKPGSQEALWNQAYAWFSAGDHEQAQRCYEALLPLAPETGKVWHHISSCLLRRDLKEETLAACRKALAEPDLLPVSIADIAGTFNIFHLLEEEHDILVKALQRFPEQPDLLFELALCESRRKNDAEALALLRRIPLQQQAPALRGRVLTEMGHLLDRMGCYDEAYQAFVDSSQAQREEFKRLRVYKTQDVVKESQALLDAPSAEAMWRPALEIHPGPMPVFLVGFPRSGTTLVERVLDAHSRINVLSEPDTVFNVERSLWKHPSGYPGCLPGLSPLELQQLREIYWNSALRATTLAEGSTLVDKQPMNLAYAPLLHRMFPGAKYIRCVRHPADACLSAFMQNFQPNREMSFFLTMEDTVSRFIQLQDFWDGLVETLQLDEYVLVYERLVEDFEGETLALTKFLGLEYEAQMAEFYKDAQRKRVMTPSYQQVVNPIYKTSAYRFRHYLPHLQPFLPSLRPYMERYGYVEQ